MKETGILRGAYHFYDPKQPPKNQAEYFIKVVGKLEKDDFPPMLDLEGSSIGGLSVSVYQNDVIEWLQIVEKHYGVSPIIYTDNPFGNEFLKNQIFSKYKLWVAEYTDQFDLRRCRRAA